MKTRLNSLVALTAIGASYFALAAGAIALTRLSGGVALLWLANAPLIAALCSAPPHRWLRFSIAALIGALAATAASSPVPLTGAMLSTINVAGGVLAALLLRRWGVAHSPFDSGRSIALFILAAGIVAPVASGIAGAALVSRAFPVQFLPALFDWLVGHGLGNLIGTPLALLVTHREIDWPRLYAPRGGVKAAGATLFVLATTAVVFLQDGLPLLFLTIVPVLVATFTFRRLGAAVSILVIALGGGALTASGSGPVMLVHSSEAVQLQFFQFYLAILFLIALPVAAMLAQRDTLLHALAESESRYRQLADNATDIMLTLDPDGTIRFASSAIRELGHLDPDSLIGRNAMGLVHVEDRARVRAVHLKALKAPDRTFTVEYRGIKGNGDASWFESNMRAVRGPDGRVVASVSVIRDLGARKKREAELEHAASTDPLTGLLNRGAFRLRLDEAMKHPSQPATLAMLDLDHFKRVNDRHGHATGDAALLALAELLREDLRPGDSVARIGGEEFAILFAGLALAQAAPICDRLRAALAERPLPLPRGGTLAITMSIGLSALDPDKTIDAIFAEADAALYAAKESGRNRTQIAGA